AGDVRHDEGAAAQVAFVFRAVTLPALVALVLVVPFRVPREWIEVLLLPVIVTVPAVVWMQAGAWLIAVDDGVSVAGGRRGWPVVWPLAAVSVLLLVFQVVLRPGVAFY